LATDWARHLDVYFYKHDYFMANPDGTYQERRIAEFRRDLENRGLDQKWHNDLFEVIDHHRAVSFAGPLSGHKAGLYHYNNEPILVTKGPYIIEARKGPCPKIMAILEGMLGPQQLPYVLGWLKNARGSMLKGILKPGQVLILCGPKNCGKSFTQEHIFTPMLGGRSANPFAFMVGITGFNSELFAAEHWMIDDEVPQEDPKARRQVGALIKQIASNESGRWSKKNVDALKLPLFARLSISCNDDDHSLLVLPPVDESLEGKVILCAVQRSDFQWPNSDEKRRNLLGELDGEYPGFAHLLDSYQIPESLSDQRYGIAGYQDQTIAKKLARIGQEFELLTLARLAVEHAKTQTFPFEGTADEIYKLIHETEHLKDGLRRITSSPDGLGRIFSRLVAHQQPGLYKRTLAGRPHYSIDKDDDA
jgi:hypothetical protein